MFIIYNIFLNIFAILLLPVILVAFATTPKLRAGFWQKIGFYNKLNLEKPKTIWIHAVSVGEVAAVEGFIKKVKATFTDCNIVLSTVTRTGQAVAKSRLSIIADKILYFPYDFTFAVKSAIKTINPDIVIIAETEIWPNLSNELKKKNIPLVIVNGRISPNSYKGYKRLSLFFSKILSKYALILMQTQGDKDRIVDIGAPEASTKVMGNLKFDITNKLDKNQIAALKNELKTENYKVLIAGSTHAGEDEIVLDVYKKLKEEIVELKLILAPRHPERNKDVMEQISQITNKFGLRSKKDNFDNCDIIMLDTMGELGKLYSASDIAFIGGSFSGTGGHNPLEAAIYNKPSISGPTVFNFKDIYKYMTEAKASIIVQNKEEFYNKTRELLKNNISYTQASEACRIVFEQNSGALEYSINEIKGLL